MQNFKSYLKENYKDKKPVLFLPFRRDNGIESNYTKLSGILREKLNNQDLFGHTFIYDIFNANGQTQLDLFVNIDKEENLYELQQKIDDYLEYFPLMETRTEVRLYDTLSIKIDFTTVKFMNRDPISLEEIGNYLSCEILHFYNNICISGGLGLLKIKKLKSILIHSTKQKEFEWMDIIKKHLKDRDIIACAEELIENGLKEYAKF